MAKHRIFRRQGVLLRQRSGDQMRHRCCSKEGRTKGCARVYLWWVDWGFIRTCPNFGDLWTLQISCRLFHRRSRCRKSSLESSIVPLMCFQMFWSWINKCFCDFGFVYEGLGNNDKHQNDKIIFFINYKNQHIYYRNLILIFFFAFSKITYVSCRYLLPSSLFVFIFMDF